MADTRNRNAVALGKRRQAKMTPAERAASAAHASRIRWQRHRDKAQDSAKETKP